MRRVALLLLIAAVFVAAWRTFDEIPLVVIGQPSTSGTLQSAKEAPFFTTLHEKTGLPVRITYRPVEMAGFKDTHQLQMLKDGVFDLVSLRFPQNRQLEPLLEGIDPAGMIPDFQTARLVNDAYAPTLDRALQQRFAVKLLGVWSFGPQELFSRLPLHGLDDIKGRTVRIGDASLAPIITALGGIPAIMPFDETGQALAIGLIDCAVTSAASATYAGWTRAAPHYLPISMHFGLNGYVISLTKWNSLSRPQQAILQRAFDAYIADLWHFSEDIHTRALRGGRGLLSKHGDPSNLVICEPTANDVRRMRDVCLAVSFPLWVERCEAVHANAITEWREHVASILELPSAGPPPIAPHGEPEP
jgi:TRAP-type C4-dicarboxylate transport system substrate-binding protein